MISYTKFSFIIKTTKFKQTISTGELNNEDFVLKGKNFNQ